MTFWLAQHIAHQFIRDHIILDQDNVNFVAHFENIQSSNWQPMRRSQKMDAVRKEKFWFRKEVGHVNPPLHSESPALHGETPPTNMQESTFDRGAINGKFEEMALTEIYCGKSEYFPGLLAIAEWHIATPSQDEGTRERVLGYLQYIKRCATGESGLAPMSPTD